MKMLLSGPQHQRLNYLQLQTQEIDKPRIVNYKVKVSNL